MDIEIEISKLVDHAENGHICPVEAYAQLDEFEKLIKQAKEQLRPTAVNELELYGKEGKAFGGKQYVVANTSRYSYEYPDAIKQMVTEANAQKKSYETLAKMQKAGLFYADPETGEEVEVVPAKKSTTTTIKGTKVKGGSNG